MGVPCWKRFLWELRPSYPFFSLEEPSGDEIQQDSINNKESSTTATHATTTFQHNNRQRRRYIDVAASFAPSYIAIPIRFFFLYWSLQVLYTDISTYPPHNLYIYMGYLTHWGHLLSNCYFIGSFLCALCCCAVRQPLEQQLDDGAGGAGVLAVLPVVPGRLVRITWGLYSCVAPLEIAITMLYWSGATFLSGHGTYVTVMEHGGIATLILIDGLLVGLVPIRAKHVVYLFTVSVCYMTWSVIDAIFEIGNGEWGPEYEDDALYPVLNWNDDRHGATIVSAFVICVLSPCLFYGCWALSLLKKSASSYSSRIIFTGDDITDDVNIIPHGCCYGRFDGSRRPLYPLDGNNGLSTSDALSVPDYKVMEDKEVV